MKILVIGDSCTDKYVYTKSERLCPEAPVPVLQKVRETENLGMAGNVYRNLEALGAEVDLISNIGPDPRHGPGIEKIRFVDNATNQMFIRYDVNDYTQNIGKKKLHGINFGIYDAVVISDYNKGFLETHDIDYIARTHPITFMDTKKILGSWAAAVTYIKLNQYEWQKSLAEGDVAGLIEKTVLTLGNHGCSFQGMNYPVQNVEIKDVSGAGDTFLAGLVVNYIKTKDINCALHFANECATKVVQMKGVTTV